MRKVILDCDPGLDDSIAIILASKLKEIELLCITIVDGNTGLDLGSKNACTVLHNIGIDNISVYKGIINDNRLVQRNQTSYNIHGKDGLGDLDINRNIVNYPKDDAITYLKNTLLNSEEKITIVAVGPLTNIANLITLYPSVKDKIEELVIMGGAVNREGNITKYAEFNIYFDPVSAKKVFESGLNITLISLNATLKMLISKDDIEYLKNSDNISSKLSGKILERYGNGYLMETGNWLCPIHDATCILYLVNPEIVKFEYKNISVITSGENIGETIEIPTGNKLKVSMDGDSNLFKELIKYYLGKGE